MLSLRFFTIFALLSSTIAAAQPHGGLIHVPIMRRGRSDRVANLQNVIEAMRNKYSFQSTVLKSKRANSAAIPLSDELNDNTYSGVINVGTPAQTFNIILDTGSSDFWVATTPCTSCASDIPLFDPSKSSTYQATTTEVELQYGLGDVNGTISNDNVTFGGFTISNQTLLSVTEGTISLMLSDGLSGLMGLAFAPLSILDATPFWQTLYETNQLSEPLFSFYLERYINQPLMVEAPGGMLTLGGTNSSLYQGSIEYTNVTGTPAFWSLNVSSITIQGTTIDVSPSMNYAIIDTGTTLIAAPTSVITNMWSKIPGSIALDGEYTGLYAFPCNTSISVSISFGGTNWAISPMDMNVGTVTAGMCAGAIFDAGALSGGFGNTWIIGDTFLKNVYSVFRAEPASVGFAQLANDLISSNVTFDPNPVQSGSLPAPTTSVGTTDQVGAAKNITTSFSLILLAIVVSYFTILL